jgi:Mrp family chromosome partitioning ATPase
MAAFIEQLRNLDYDYILLDAPPLLGIADSQVLARHVDELLLVNRLDRLTLDHISELREVLDRLDTRPLGIVAIGARGEMSPYYLARRAATVREPEPSS